MWDHWQPAVLQRYSEKIPHWENKMQVKEMEITKKLSVKESSKEREYFIKGHKNRIVS